MKRVLCLLGLVACGPGTPMDDDGETSSDPSTTDATATTLATSVGTSATSATTVTATTTATTAPADESTTADTSSSDGEETEFIQRPDFSDCFQLCIECDIWAQDCGNEQKCMAWANDGGDVWNALKCSPLDQEPAVIGEMCSVEGGPASGIDDCELGAICWGVDPLTNEGTCVPMCSGSEANPVCPEGLECTTAFEAPLIVCLPPCDPLTPTCAADEVCSTLDHYPTSDIRFACQPTPPFEPQPYGTACGNLQLCDEGLVCVSAEHVPGCTDADCCTQLGRTDAPAACPDATQSCIPLMEPNAEWCHCGVV